MISHLELVNTIQPASELSLSYGLIINKTKCVECLFYSKNTYSQLSFFFLNGEALFREQTVKYLGVHFSPNITWSTHIYTVFVKCLKLSFLYSQALFYERPQVPFMTYHFGTTDT